MVAFAILELTRVRWHQIVATVAFGALICFRMVSEIWKITCLFFYKLVAAFDQNLLGLRSTFQDLNLVSILGVTRLKPNSAREVLFQSRFPGLLYCANAVLLFGP